MTTAVAIGLLFAVTILVAGLQITAGQLQRFGLDNRSPGPIIESRRTRRFVVSPPELDQLRAEVEESLASEAVAQAKLRPVLSRLRAGAPNQDPAVSDQPRSTKRSRLWLEGELVDLERRWGIEQPGS